jgi:hypothetical protein
MGPPLARFAPTVALVQPRPEPQHLDRVAPDKSADPSGGLHRGLWAIEGSADPPSEGARPGHQRDRNESNDEGVLDGGGSRVPPANTPNALVPLDALRTPGKLASPCKIRINVPLSQVWVCSPVAVVTQWQCLARHSPQAYRSEPEARGAPKGTRSTSRTLRGKLWMDTKKKLTPPGVFSGTQWMEFH